MPCFVNLKTGRIFISAKGKRASTAIVEADLTQYHLVSVVKLYAYLLRRVLFRSAYGNALFYCPRDGWPSTLRLGGFQRLSDDLRTILREKVRSWTLKLHFSSDFAHESRTLGQPRFLLQYAPILRDDHVDNDLVFRALDSKARFFFSNWMSMMLSKLRELPSERLHDVTAISLRSPSTLLSSERIYTAPKLEFIAISTRASDDSAVLQLIERFSVNTSVNSLKLFNLSPSTNFAAIFHKLLAWTHLHRLTIWQQCNQEQTIPYTPIAEFLRSHKQLKWLSIKGLNFECSSFNEVADALAENVSLKKLNVFGGSSELTLTPQNVDAICKIIDQNKLRGLKLPFRFAYLIESVFASAQLVNRFSLPPQEAIDRIATSLRNNIVLRYFPMILSVPYSTLCPDCSIIHQLIRRNANELTYEAIDNLLVSVALSMPSMLPPYVLLEIVDAIPFVERVSRLFKINRLIALCALRSKKENKEKWKETKEKRKRRIRKTRKNVDRD